MCLLAPSAGGQVDLLYLTGGDPIGGHNGGQGGLLCHAGHSEGWGQHEGQVLALPGQELALLESAEIDGVLALALSLPSL